MPEREQFRAIKGTRDILPPDSSLWNWFEQAARETFESYNFRDIRTPIIEQTELFSRSIGIDTDIVIKEMYGFPKKLEILRRATTDQIGDLRNEANVLRFGQALAVLVANLTRALEQGDIPSTRENREAIRDLENLSKATVDRWNSGHRTPNPVWHGWFGDAAELIGGLQLERIEESQSLRPEGTAPICRAYIEHGMQTLPGDQKLYYIGPMFRRERPQKGRYRQFYQIGAEVLGPSDAPAIDAELLEMLLVFFRRVGLTRTTLYINSIGDKNCRPQYVARLREFLVKVKDHLKEDSQRRIETNPLRVLDSKIPEEQQIIENLPRISDHLCDDCRAHYAKLKDELRLRKIAFEENWRLVRGLDYYTRTTFEVTAEGLGSQNAVCGGGRYDGLVELLGGPPTKGIGFAIGSDRSILSIQESRNLPHLPGLSVYVAWMGAKAYPAAVAIARKLREAGLSVELPPEEMKFKKSLSLADKLRARYALILGEDEVASHTFTLKRLSDAEQKKLNENELLEYLESEKRGSRA